MSTTKTLAHQATKMADSSYKRLQASVSEELDGELFHRLSMQSLATHGMFTENHRVELLSLKTTIESFQ